MREDAASCESCGAVLAPLTLTTPTGLPAPLAVAPPALTPPSDEPYSTAPRPWVRYFARGTDNMLFAFFSGFLAAIWPPLDAVITRISDRAFGMVLLLLWVFVEAALLAVFGTTPGKWLLRTRVQSRDGRPLGYLRSLERSFIVWFRGMGIGFPLAALFTTIAAYNRLTEERITSWDFEGDFVVTHRKIGVLRALAVILIQIVFFALTIWAVVQKVNPAN